MQAWKKPSKVRYTLLFILGYCQPALAKRLKMIMWPGFCHSLLKYLIDSETKDLRRCTEFDPITFTISENSNYWWKSLLEVIRQNIDGWCHQPFCFQKFVDNVQQCFAFKPQANFSVHNLNFHWRWRWWDQI